MTPRIHRLSPAQKLIIAGSLLIFLALGIVTAMQMRPWVDEAFYGVPALTLANHGYFGSPFLNTTPGNLLHLEKHAYWIMPVFSLVQAAWDLVFPQTLWSIRMISTLSGLAAVLCWGFFFHKITRDSTATVFFFLLASCDYVLTSAAGFARPDMMAFMFQAAAFASFMALRESNLSLAVLASQTCVVLSGMTHPNGGLLAMVGVLYLTLFMDGRRIRGSHLLIAALPYITGGLGWGCYILQDVEGFRAQWAFQTPAHFSGLQHPFDSVLRELTHRYLPQMGLGLNFHPLKSVSFIADFLAITFIFVTPELRRLPSARLLLGIMACFLVFYVFFDQTKQDYYFSYLSTIYTGLLALVLGWLWERRALPQPLIALAVAGIMAVQAGGAVMKLRHNPWAEYTAASDWLKQHAGPNDLIDGSYELGFLIGYTPRFMDDSRFGTGNGRKPDFIFMDPIYDDRLPEQRAVNEEIYEQMKNRLAEYREVYSKGPYRVLMRAEGPKLKE
ncbi:MAG: hypothetical protein JWO80_1406 [Bryobacterales bacterium]|nr:hypothetical protein [Bryobacterales bacterium]